MKTTLSEAVLAIQGGDLVAMPTETVYGLAADISQPYAVAKIFALKNRPLNHPLIVHIADHADILRYARDIPPYAMQLAKAFWPGPLTLILSRSEAVGDWITGGQETVGLRMPQHQVALDLIKAVGVPLAAPSANRFGKISPTTAAHVRDEFGEQVPVLEGGACQIGIESTIVLATSPETCMVLRPGEISCSAIQAVIGSTVQCVSGAKSMGSPRVSGGLDSHYAPTKPAVLIEDISALARLKAQHPNQLFTLYYSAQFKDCEPSESRRLPATPAAYAQQLYAALREADQSHASILAIEAPPNDVAWSAVSDRLKKATARGLMLDRVESTG